MNALTWRWLLKQSIHVLLGLLAALALWIVTRFIDVTGADTWWEHTLVLGAILLPVWLPLLIGAGVWWKERRASKRLKVWIAERDRVAAELDAAST